MARPAATAWSSAGAASGGRGCSAISSRRWRGDPCPEPSLGEVCEVMVEHARLLVATLGEESRDARLPQAHRLVHERVSGRTEVRRRSRWSARLRSSTTSSPSLDPTPDRRRRRTHQARAHQRPDQGSLPEAGSTDTARDCSTRRTVPDDDHVMASPAAESVRTCAVAGSSLASGVAASASSCCQAPGCAFAVRPAEHRRNAVA